MKRWMVVLFMLCNYLPVYSQAGATAKEEESRISEEYQENNPIYTSPKEPESFEQEKTAVKSRIDELFQALIDKNVEKVFELCDQQDGYREKFEENKENFQKMAESLKSAKLTHLAADYDSSGERIGQITVGIGSKTFALPIVKIKGKWFFQDL